jgi:hypothetical protein
MPSFSSAPARRFAAQGARQGAAANAISVVTYAGRTLCVSRTGIDHRRAVEAGPFEGMPEATIRVCAADHAWFLPDEAAARAAVGQSLTLDGQLLKIATVKRLPLAGEIVLTLAKA